MSKEILFVGPYRSSDGWGLAAQDFLEALQHTGHKILAKPIFMSNNVDRTPNISYDKLESLSFSPDAEKIVIQNTLPHWLDYDGRVDKNIGLFYIETSNFQHNDWLAKMNLLDEIWVCSDFERQTLLDMKIKVPVRVVNMPFNMNVPGAKPLHIPEIEDCFVFYFIGEYIQRKNLEALLIAYHREFKNTEPVSLIIKTGISGASVEVAQQKILQDIQTLKQKMRIYATTKQYLPEVLIVGHIAAEEMWGLHARGDCFVMPSRGESTCRPVVEAMQAGNMVIVNGGTSMEDTVGKCGCIVDHRTTPAFVSDNPLPNIYTSNELWSDIDILDLQSYMRTVYELNEDQQQDEKEMIKEELEKFTYEAVAAQMNEVL